VVCLVAGRVVVTRRCDDDELLLDDEDDDPDFDEPVFLPVEIFALASTTEVDRINPIHIKLNILSIIIFACKTHYTILLRVLSY
jgi:hypothetical protein